MADKMRKFAAALSVVYSIYRVYKTFKKESK